MVKDFEVLDHVPNRTKFDFLFARTFGFTPEEYSLKLMLSSPSFQYCAKHSFDTECSELVLRTKLSASRTQILTILHNFSFRPMVSFKNYVFYDFFCPPKRAFHTFIRRLDCHNPFKDVSDQPNERSRLYALVQL